MAAERERERRERGGGEKGVEGRKGEKGGLKFKPEDLKSFWYGSESQVPFFLYCALHELPSYHFLVICSLGRDDPRISI
jgi:hypothetical protein